MIEGPKTLKELLHRLVGSRVDLGCGYVVLLHRTVEFLSLAADDGHLKVTAGERDRGGQTNSGTASEDDDFWRRRGHDRRNYGSPRQPPDATSRDTFSSN